VVYINKINLNLCYSLSIVIQQLCDVCVKFPFMNKAFLETCYSSGICVWESANLELIIRQEMLPSGITAYFQVQLGVKARIDVLSNILRVNYYI
jgi:hypothetical protein